MMRRTPRLLVLLSVALAGLPVEAAAQGVAGHCSTDNGDVNGDGSVNLSDAVSLLGWLFGRGPAPVWCPVAMLPDTGQEGCFTDERTLCDDERCPGQDGHYLTGCRPEGRFVDNGDGSVTDTCTRLMWQKETPNGVGDAESGPTWSEALAYCDDLSLAGHDDWRLPDVRELGSLVDYGHDVRDLPIDPIFDAVDGEYWSSTTRADDPHEAWRIRFSNGSTIAVDKSRGLSAEVRALRTVTGPVAAKPCAFRNGDVNGDGGINVTDAVGILAFLFRGGGAPLPICDTRPGSALPATGQRKCFDEQGETVPCDVETALPGQDGLARSGCPVPGRFVANDDGTIRDTCTGLVWWTPDVNGDGRVNSVDRLPWCLALTFCEDATFAGHDDWRLPNIRELESLTDYGRLSPMIDPIFPVDSKTYHWSSTTCASDPAAAWIAIFEDSANTRELEKGDAAPFFAVRGPAETRSSVDRCEECVAGTITAGETVSGSLATGDCRIRDRSFFDRYRFHLEEGGEVEIRLVSADFDAFIVLEDSRCLAPERTFIDFADCSRGGAEGCLALDLPPGEYAILVNSHEANVSGDYSFSVSLRESTTCSDCLVAELACGGRFGKELFSGACNPTELSMTDVYRLEIPEPTTVVIDFDFPPGFLSISPRIVLFNESCVPIALSECFYPRLLPSCAELELEAGTYFVAVTAVGEIRFTGRPYVLSVECVDGGNR